MALKDFDHVSATSVASAVEALQSTTDAVAIAGGTDLLGILKDRVHPRYAQVVVDLKTVPGLSTLDHDKRGLVIGALVSIADVANHPLVKEHYALLAEAARAVASPQLRNQGTVGGNICQEPRCWYYRAPDNQFHCLRKGGDMCGAVLGENRFHSIFGAASLGPSPCSSGCPAEVEIPQYLEHVRAGRMTEAAQVLLGKNPMPAITGRACPHFCELTCTRTGFDEAVSIRAVERHVGDYILDHVDELMPTPRRNSGKHVAIVGAGPAGLAAAYYLRQRGHEVTVFDAQPEAGGMLTYCIPAYRLPKTVVARLINAYRQMGITFVLGKQVGRGKTTVRRLRQDYDAVFLATGAWKQKALKLDGESLLRSGIDFLTDIQRTGGSFPGKRVLVIGGGSVAVDVAISARRLGAQEVMMACLEARGSMPAVPEDLEQAARENIELLPSWGPHRILAEGGTLRGMELVKCTSVFDADGHFKPTFDPAVTTTVLADTILLAIGQATDLGYLDASIETARGLIVTDDATGVTNVPGVYAGGDVVTGPATVVEAMVAGRRAAEAISASFGLGKTRAKVGAGAGEHSLDAIHPGALAKSRRLVVLEPAPERLHIRAEDTATAGLGEVQDEAARCANCGCVAVNASDLAPALMALKAKIKTNRRTVPADELFAARPYGSTVLDPAEVVTAIFVPAPRPSTRQSFQKFRLRKAIDFPIVSVAASLVVEKGTVKDATIALGAVAPTPLRARKVEEFLVGKPLSPENLEIATAIAVKGVFPLEHNRYKIQLVRELLRRALSACAS